MGEIVTSLSNHCASAKASADFVDSAALSGHIFLAWSIRVFHDDREVWIVSHPYVSETERVISRWGHGDRPVTLLRRWTGKRWARQSGDSRAMRFGGCRLNGFDGCRTNRSGGRWSR